MEALAASSLAEGDEVECLEPFAGFLASSDDGVEVDVEPRIKVENQPPGQLGMVGLAIPGMKLERRHLRERN